MGIFSQLISRYSDCIPDGIAIIHGDRILKWREFELRISRLASGLHGLGIRPGTKCGIMLHNSPEFFEANFAIQKLGGIPVPFNWRYKSSELKYLVQQSDIDLLIFHGRFLDQVSQLRQDLGNGIRYLCLDPPQIQDWFMDYRTLIQEASPGKHPRLQIPLESDAVIIFTGGTTGYPKGVVLSYRHLIRDIELVLKLLLNSLPRSELEFRSNPEFNRRLWLALGSMLRPFQILAQDPEFQGKNIQIQTKDADLTLILEEGLKIFRGFHGSPDLKLEYPDGLIWLVNRFFIPVIANKSRIPLIKAFISQLMKPMLSPEVQLRGSKRLGFRFVSRARNLIKGTGLGISIGCFPPAFHLAGYAVSMLWILSGASIIFSESISKARGFDPEEALRVIHRYKPEVFFLVPSMWERLLDHSLDGYDTSGLKIVLTGAMTMPGQLKRRLLHAFPNSIIADAYGQTETSPVVSMRLDGDPAGVVDRCVGAPLPGVEIRILDPSGKHVPQGGIGEIVVKGEIIMKGYYKDPLKTQSKIRDGWLYTGDLGYVDSQGNLHILERADEVIISGGEKIYPEELEQVIKSHPKVQDCCVIGVPDREWGQIVRAIVVPNPGAELGEQEIIQWCSQRLAGYKKPRSVIFVDELPRSPVGKLLRAQVKQIYGKG